jgi:hypothetical protein
MIDDLEDLLKAAVVEVFGTMIGLQVRLEPVSSTIRRMFSFRSLEHQLVVEIMLRPESPT